MLLRKTLELMAKHINKHIISDVIYYFLKDLTVVMANRELQSYNNPIEWGDSVIF